MNSSMSPIIGVIDTGVDPTHPWLEGSIIGGVTIRGGDGTERIQEGFQDLVGHGTAVASVIHSYCPEARIFAVRVWGHGFDDLPGVGVSESVLAAALDCCMSHGVQIANISFSMSNYEPDG